MTVAHRLCAHKLLVHLCVRVCALHLRLRSLMDEVICTCTQVYRRTAKVQRLHRATVRAVSDDVRGRVG